MHINRLSCLATQTLSMVVHQGHPILVGAVDREVKRNRTRPGDETAEAQALSTAGQDKSIKILSAALFIVSGIVFLAYAMGKFVTVSKKQMQALAASGLAGITMFLILDIQEITVMTIDKGGYQCSLDSRRNLCCPVSRVCSVCKGHGEIRRFRFRWFGWIRNRGFCGSVPSVQHTRNTTGTIFICRCFLCRGRVLGYGQSYRPIPYHCSIDRWCIQSHIRLNLSNKVSTILFSSQISVILAG